MVRFIVGIAVVVFTTFCGRFLAKKYTIRKAFFQEAESFNEGFLEELGYTKRPFEEYCLKRAYKGEFGQMLHEELNRRAKRKSTLSLDGYSFLNAEERAFFSEYFCAFGRGDAQSQKSYFSQAKNRLQSLKIKAEEECKRNVELFTKMGFLLGLALLIIII